MAEDMSLPKVTKRGLLDKPHPIRTRGDINRARVLPMPEGGGASPELPHRRVGGEDEMQARKPVADRSLDRPKGAFDYVRKRNAASRSLSGGR